MGHVNEVLWLWVSYLCYPDFSAPICKAAVQEFATSQEQWVLKQMTSLHRSDCSAIFPSHHRALLHSFVGKGSFPVTWDPNTLWIQHLCGACVSRPSLLLSLLCRCEFWIVFDLVPLRVLSRCAACGFVPCVDIWRSQSKCQCTYFRYSNPACLPMPALCPDCC